MDQQIVSSSQGSQDEGRKPRVGAKRRGRKKTGGFSLGDLIRALLLMNILPVIAGLVLLYYWQRGEIERIRIPEGVTSTLAVLGVDLVLLILVASLSLPAAHRAVKALGESWGTRKATIRGEVPGSKFGSALVLPFVGGTYLIVWPIRFGLILISLALIGVFLVFCVRIFEPVFLQEWVDRALSLLGNDSLKSGQSSGSIPVPSAMRLM